MNKLLVKLLPNRTATVMGAIAIVPVLLTQIGESNRALGDAIASCCESFEYEKILTLLPQEIR